MTEYKITITPRSPFSTPLHSDTLFGHLCWALRYSEGEKALTEFLTFLKDEQEICLLSSGFPDGYFPRPVLGPLTVEENKRLQEKFFSIEGEIKFVAALKRLKKISWISEKLFNEVKSNLSPFHLYEKLLSSDGDIQESWKEVEEWHNAKNRRSDVVIQGMLFAKKVTFYKQGFSFIIFQKDDYFGKEKLGILWKLVGEMGYGADSSSGRGRFSCSLEEYSLKGVENPNGIMILSHSVPSPTDPREGHYEILTKFGKLGGIFASTGKVFKQPIIMLQPGATFQVMFVKKHYGRVVENVHHSYPKVIHYGLGYPLPVRLS